MDLKYSPLIPIEPADFANPDKRKDWIKTKNMQVLSLQSTLYPETTIDIFVTEPFNFDKAFKTETTVELTPEIRLNLVNISTLIKMKQDTGRAKDQDDINHLEIILKEESGE